MRHKPLISGINVVPYIDVMLVLLVIFMVTTPLLSEGVSIELPEAKANVLNSEAQEPLIVTIDAKGRYFLNVMDSPHKAIDAETLASHIETELQLAKQNNEQRMLLVKGDKRVDYATVMQVMVLLQQAGASNIGLMTETPAEERQLLKGYSR